MYLKITPEAIEVLLLSTLPCRKLVWRSVLLNIRAFL